MKYFISILTMTCLILTLGCKIQRNIVLKSNDLCCNDTIVTPGMYLSNRIPDCDKSLRYMDSVVVPVSLSIPDDLFEIGSNYKIPRVIEGNFKIMCDSVNMYNSKKYLYYINTKCFEGRPSTEIFKLFCRDSQLELINKIDSIKSSSENNWKLIMLAHGGFGVSFDIQGKNVISSKTWKSYSESH